MRKAFFLTSGPPVPIVGARRIRDAQIITALSERLPVEVMCISSETDRPSILAATEKRFGPNVSVSCHPLDRPNIAIRALDVVRPHFAQGYSSSIESAIRSRAQPGDLVWLSRLRMAKYVALTRKLGCFSILDEHQVESDLLFDNAFAKMRYWHHGLTAAQCALYEKKLSYAADVVVTASPADAFRMQKLAPNTKVQVIPPAIDAKAYAPDRAARSSRSDGELRLAFLGDPAYHPNLHALEWARSELKPRLEACRCSPVLRMLTQSGVPADASSRFPDVEFVTYSDPAGLLAALRDSDAAIFPLRYGRGNRIHILEAMASGVPVVSTGRGADGLALEPLEDLCIAEQPDEFASLVMRVTKDAAFRARMIEHGLRTVRATYDWSQTSGPIGALLAHLGIEENARPDASASSATAAK